MILKKVCDKINLYFALAKGDIMKKLLAVFLSAVVMLAALPSGVISASAETEGETEEREVYYSDLFYGYSHYLTDSTVLTSYYENNYDMFCDIYKTFYNSSGYTWAAFRETINTATDFKSFAKSISDATGLTDFTYEAMLDSANVKFAGQIVNYYAETEDSENAADDANAAEGWGNVSKTADMIKDIASVAADFEKLNDIKNMPDSEIISGFMTAVKNSGLFDFLSSENVTKFTDYFVENKSDIMAGMEVCATVLDAVKVYSTAVAMENLRLEFISDARNGLTSGSVTSDGINRLYSQLQSDCFEYFEDNYIVNAGLLAVEKAVMYYLDINEIGGDVGVLSTAMTLLKVASTVVFDVIFDIPTIDDLTTQIVLSEYVKDFYTALQSNAQVFSAPFISSEIESYEKSFAALVAATNAAMDASERIVTDSNSGRLSTARNTYYGRDMYTIVINQGLHTLAITPEEELVKTNFGTWEVSGPTLCGGTDYPDDSTAVYCPWSGLDATLYNRITGTLVVPEGEEFILNGDFIIGNTSTYYFSSPYAYNYGTLTVNGNLSVIGYNGSYYARFYNYNVLKVNGNVTVNYHGKFESRGDAVYYLSGDAKYQNTYNNYSCICLSTLILTGDAKQTFTRIYANTVIDWNESAEGVEFTYWNSNFSVLFNHNGNVFSCPSSAIFTDYDGDGMKDNVDPYPTVGNPCTIAVACNDSSFGTVSESSIETVGGTEHTVTATPEFKYCFVKWQNAAGKTVSTNAEYTFVAKGDNTLTAVFEKRKQPITAESSGGTITAPAEAEIESEVLVTVTENEGYIYQENSLKYNATVIENGSFIMPDEPVTLTAEFLYNDYYLPLKQKLAEAAAITYESYSAESFAALQSAITAANEALGNHVSKEDSDTHISALNSAMAALTPKYITAVRITAVPTLYIGVEGLIDGLEVTLDYDNATTEIITDYILSGFDPDTAGEQEITVSYGEFSDTATVNVLLRQLSDVTFAEISEQLYTGQGTVYEPGLSAAYDLTGDILTNGVDYTVAYSDNTAPGTAAVTVTGTGDYEGEITLSFVIYCEHSYEVAQYTAPTCTADGYRKEICSICADEKESFYKKVFTENLPESKHSYTMGLRENYYFTAEGAESLVLSFNKSTYFNTNDYLYIYDSAGTLIGKYGGSTLSEATLTVSGETVRLYLETGYDVLYGYGFALSGVTAYYPNTELAAFGHTEGEWVTEKDATVYEEGVRCKYCTVCGELLAEETLEKLTFWGDADLNGAIDSSDLAVIRKAVLFPDTEYNITSDTTGDGTVDIKDLIRLKKYLAGQDITLGI